MKQEQILFLGPVESPLIAWLRDQGELVIQTADKLDAREIASQGHRFLISYGYRHILGSDILELFPDRAINLHISYLPWNRGADPNFWSFVDNTPKGVTIHYLDNGVDTGDIIVQKKIEFDTSVETFTTSFTQLQSAIESLFQQNWNDIKAGVCPRHKQVGNGSFHKVKDKEKYLHLFTNGWDTKVSVVNDLTGDKQLF